VARGRNRRRVDRERPAPPPGALRQGLTLALAWAAGTACAAALAVGGYRAFAAGELLRVQAIRVTGLARATPAEVLAYSPVKVGDDFVSADVDAMAAAIGRHPWVRSVKVRRRFPLALDVQVEERDPRALVDLGGLYLVDADGKVFKRASPGDGLDLPVVTGFTREDYQERRGVLQPKLQAAVAFIQSYGDAGLGPLAPLSEFHRDDDESVVLYVGDRGTQVRLGQGDHAQKLVRLRQVLEEIRAQGKRPDVIYLDDRSRPDRAVVRPLGIAEEGAGVGPAPARAETAREGQGWRRGRDAPLVRR